MKMETIDGMIAPLLENLKTEITEEK